MMYSRDNFVEFEKCCKINPLFVKIGVDTAENGRRKGWKQGLLKFPGSGGVGAFPQPLVQPAVHCSLHCGSFGGLLIAFRRFCQSLILRHIIFLDLIAILDFVLNGYVVCIWSQNARNSVSSMKIEREYCLTIRLRASVSMLYSPHPRAGLA